MTDAKICETPRLILRKITPTDAQDLFEILGDPEVMRFSVNGPEDREGIQTFITATQKRYERDRVAQWAVIQKQTNELIGLCGIAIQMIDHIKEPEIGYRFKKKFWKQGFAAEAAIACRDYGFQQMKYPRVISIIEAANIASIRVAEKVGMKLEKQSYFHKIPVRIYSLLNPLQK